MFFLRVELDIEQAKPAWQALSRRSGVRVVAEGGGGERWVEAQVVGGGGGDGSGGGGGGVVVGWRLDRSAAARLRFPSNPNPVSVEGPPHTFT